MYDSEFNALLFLFLQLSCLLGHGTAWRLRNPTFDELTSACFLLLLFSPICSVDSNMFNSLLIDCYSILPVSFKVRI